MKKLILIFTIICLFTSIFSQISHGGKPFAQTHTLEKISKEKVIEAVSKQWKADALENYNKYGTVELISKNFKTNFTPYNSGKWEILKNGDKIWRLKIKAKDALAINAYYKDFYLAKGAKMYLYTPNYSQVIGAFTQENNTTSKQFATELIKGNTLIIELYEPKKIHKKSMFTIHKVSNYFKDVFNTKGTNSFGDSQSCQVNINCSPEGDNWQDEKKGVARILVSGPSGQGWCSGSLINNTNLDCKPYFLTAYHCGNTSSASDFNDWIFYFNYEHNGCSNSSEPSSNTITGASVKARSNDLTSTSVSSDFLLLELNQVVPDNYNVYYNGWNRSTTAPSSGVAIHHPAGDVKKISTYTSTPTVVGVSWSGAGYTIINGQTHWSVKWVSTQNGFGVSEGGSSGSPMFNSAGLIVGTLSGGGSSCTSTTSKDQYGRISYHWASNSTSQSKQLAPWLDPTNSGVSSLTGTYSPCTAATTNDAAIVEIINPKGDMCDNNYKPKIILKNAGAILLTSASISYEINSNPTIVFNWTGSLTKGSTEIVELAAGSSQNASNTFTVTVSNPNGMIDDNNANNSMTSTFNTNVQKAIPLRDFFETQDFPNREWFINNPDNLSTWEKTENIGSYGLSSHCMFIDNWDYEAQGQYDWFVSDAYDLSDTVSEELYFDVAYTYYHQTNVANFSYDTLGIAYSLDCGTNFYWLWKEGGEDLATLQNGLGEEFIPFDDEWETKKVSLDILKGESSVMFAFIAINGYGNNLYIDNILVGKEYVGVNNLNNDIKKISIFPNPANTFIDLNIEMSEITNIQYNILNTIGQKIDSKNIYNTKHTTERIDISSLVKGVYFIEIKTNSGNRVLKFLKE